MQSFLHLGTEACETFHVRQAPPFLDAFVEASGLSFLHSCLLNECWHVCGFYIGVGGGAFALDWLLIRLVFLLLRNHCSQIHHQRGRRYKGTATPHRSRAKPEKRHTPLVGKGRTGKQWIVHFSPYILCCD